MEAPLIVCVYRPGNGLSDEYVYRLRGSLDEHMCAPFHFVCMTTAKLKGVDTERLIRRNEGWWNKLELFRLQHNGTIFYLDLDSMVLDDITDIVTYPHDFTAAANWYSAHKIKPGDRIMNSGLMAWDGRQDLSHLDVKVDIKLDDEYSHSPHKWGDQAYIQDHLGRDFTNLEDIFPGRYVSYKMHVRRQGRVPADASIVAFHGRPRPHEVKWRLPDGHRATPRERNQAV